MSAPLFKPSSRFASQAIPIAIILSGILLSLWLQIFTRNGVVFSGDGGLKALLAQQLAQQLSSGTFPPDFSISLTDTPWVSELWQQGLYPFTAPYVYEFGSRYFITFPFTFPAVSAPFYALFGDRGLYIVPLLALWTIWGRFWQIGRRARWDSLALCIGLVTLIVASPLTLYGAMYWEHTLAVALAFWGVSALLFPRVSSRLSAIAPHSTPNQRLSNRRIIGSGILIALAVWFRPEFLCLVVAVSVAAIISWRLPQWRMSPPLTFTKVLVLIGAMAVTVGVFFALNYAIYSHPLGIHAIQIVEESTVASQIAQAQQSYQQMGLSLWRYFPAAGVVALAVVFSPELKRAALKTPEELEPIAQAKTEVIGSIPKISTRKAKLSKLPAVPIPTRFILAVTILFMLSVPLIVPPGNGGKQWGPRFYLILVPLLSVVLSEQLRSYFFRDWARRMALLVTAVALVLGIHINTVQGAFSSFKDDQTQSVSLLANYAPIAPAIAQLAQQPLPWIAMSHQFVAQQLWSALPSKTFFLTENLTQLKQLATALTQQQESEFLYVCYPHRDCPAPQTPASELTLTSGAALRFESIGTYGKYPLYKVRISK
jgi:hypothetical protein